MKVIRKVGEALIMEFEAGSPKEVFERLALIDANFTEDSCGCCGKQNIRYVKREVDNGCYLEMRCDDCNAQLSFGQHKDGKGIFKKNWDKDAKRMMPNRGWYHYQKQEGGSQAKGDAHEGTDSSQDIPF